MSPIAILFIGDCSSLFNELFNSLQDAFGQIILDKSESPTEALAIIKSNPYDVIIFSDRSDNFRSLKFFESIRKSGNVTPFILLVDKKTESFFSKAFNIGVNDIIEKNENLQISVMEIINAIRKINELSYEIHRRFTDVKNIEDAYIIQTEELEKRLWESNFLYSMPKILNLIDQSQEETFSRIISLIKDTWKNSHLLSIRIRYKGNTYETDNFLNTKWKQSSELFVFGKIIGSIEVFYQEETPAQYESAFLIEALTREISKVTERIDRNASLKKLSRAVEQSPSVIILTDREGRIEWVNPRFIEITGYSDEDLIGEIHAIFVKDELYLTPQGNIIEKIIKGGVWKGELLNKKKNGDLYWALVSISTIRNEKDLITNFVIIEQDITELKNVLEELNKSEERNKAYVKAIPDLMLRIDKYGNLLDHSIPEDFNVHLNKKLSEYIPQISKIMKIFPQKVADLFSKAMKSAFSSGESLPFDFNIPIDWTNGELKTFEIRVVSSGINEVLVIVRDITNKKAAEEAIRLRDAKEKVESIIDTMADGVLVLDPEGKNYLANQSFKDIYFHIFNATMPIILDYSSKVDTLFDTTVKKLYQEKKSQRVTLEPIEGFNVQLIATLPQSFDLAGFLIIIIQDITQFVKFDKMVKQFISTASHELRTPISVIIQSLNNLKKYENKITEEVKIRLMDSLDRNANLMFDLVNDLLLISRIDEKRIKLVLEIFQPFEMLQQIITQLEPKLKLKKIKIENRICEKLTLYGDSMRISQIFRILIDNAIKYSHDKGEVQILAYDNYQGSYNPKNINGVLFEVIDNGIGISEKDSSHIFDRFFRSNDVRNLSGTGLGLSIAKEISNLHGGEMYFESEYKKRSSFFVFIPKQASVDNLI